MGTTRSGKYLNTAGSARKVSDYAAVHSNEGTFTQEQYKDRGKVHKRLRLHSGCHGQKGLELLDKHRIVYTIVKTYPNGVRVGYVPRHKSPLKQKGVGQSWFPKKWTEHDIRKAGEQVVGLKRNRRKPDGVAVYGNYKGVRIGVIKTHGKIATVFPDSNQNAGGKRNK